MQAVRGFFNNFNTNMLILKNWLKDLWEDVSKRMGEVTDKGKQLWKDLASSAKDFASNTIGFFQHFGENVGLLWDWFGRNWKNLLSDMSRLFTTVQSNMLTNLAVFIRVATRLFITWFGFMEKEFKQWGKKAISAFLGGAVGPFMKGAEFFRETMKRALSGQKGPSGRVFLTELEEDLRRGKGLETLDDFMKRAGEIVARESKNFVNPFKDFKSSLEELPKLNLEATLGLPEFVTSEFGSRQLAEMIGKAWTKEVDPFAADAGKQIGKALGEPIIDEAESAVKQVKDTFSQGIAIVGSKSSEMLGRILESRRTWGTASDITLGGVQLGGDQGPRVRGYSPLLRPTPRAVVGGVRYERGEGGTMERVAQGIETLIHIGRRQLQKKGLEVEPAGLEGV